MTKTRACRVADRLTRERGRQFYVIHEPDDRRASADQYEAVDDYDLETFYQCARPIYAGGE